MGNEKAGSTRLLVGMLVLSPLDGCADDGDSVLGTMNAPKGKLRPAMKLWIAMVCVPALTALVMVLMRPRETVSFEIVDYVTGKRIQNATIEVSRKLTRLPLDRIPFLHISPFKHTIIPALNGLVEITHVPKVDLSCRIVVGAKSYADAFIQQQPPDECDDPDIYRILYFGDPWLHESPFEYVTRKKQFTVALEPDAGGTGRAGARYLSAPPPGSKERALMAIKRLGQKGDAKDTDLKVDWAKFQNGHWEIKLVSEGPGGDPRFDISEDGKILGIHPGE